MAFWSFDIVIARQPCRMGWGAKRTLIQDGQCNLGFVGVKRRIVLAYRMSGLNSSSYGL
jgi:hypothetical protein